MPAVTENGLPELQQLCASRRWCEFIIQAHQALAATPHAPDLALLTLRTLVECGLGGPARELLQLRRDLDLRPADRAALRSSLSAVPNGRVTWAELEATFRANLAALASCRPEWRGTEADLRAAVAHVHLHRSLHDHYLLSRRRPGELREWLADLGAGAAELEQCSGTRTQRGATAVVGARLGPLPRLYRDTHHVQLWYSHPLYLLEPDPTCFAAWLHCGDHAEWLADPRVYVFVGPDALAQCTRVWQRHPLLALPGRLVILAGDDPISGALQAAVRQAADDDQAEFERLRARLDERYRDRDAAYWARRFHPPGPLLAVTSRFTTMLRYSTRDALAALAAQGYQTEMLIESSDHELLRPADICRALLELDPLMVIALDHARHEVPYVPRNLPYLLWIQDPLPDLLSRKAGESVGPFDLVCGYYKARCTQELGYPAERFLPVVVPVSTGVFHDAALDADAAAQYVADVCYVGHGGQPLELHFQAAVTRHPAALRPRLEVVYDRVRRVLSGEEPVNPTATMDELVGSLAVVDGMALREFAYRLLDTGRRQQTLEWVAAWARRTGRLFKIYGRGWEQHPTLAEFAAGVIEHGEPLRRAYRASALTLQLLPSGFLHQRGLEAILSGAVPLLRYCPADFARLPIETYVAERAAGRDRGTTASIFPRLERVTFRTPAEFEALAERYLGSIAQRQEVLADFRQVVLRDYTYTVVVQKVMDAYHNLLARRAQDVSAAPANASGQA